MLDAVQDALDVAGLAPGAGILADLANAGISYVRGNYGDAALSMAAAVPVLGTAAGAGKIAHKLNKFTKGAAFAKGVNPKSVKQFGHTFNTHGAGAKNTRKLQGRAAGTGNPQGQFLDNQKAAEFLSQHSGLTKVTDVNLPAGLGQIIRPDGSISAATKVRIVPNSKGGFRSAFPID